MELNAFLSEYDKGKTRSVIMGKLISILFFMCQIGKKVVETHSNYRHFGVCFKPSYFKDVPRRANDGETFSINSFSFNIIKLCFVE